MAGLMTLLSGVFALLIWVFAKSYGVLVFYALIGGTVAGTFWATVAPVTAEVVGLRDVPSALNLIWLVIVLPCTFSEPIALEIVGGTGEYIGAQLFTGFMYVAAAMCLLGLRGWKIGEVEDAGRGNGGATATTAGDTAVDAGGGDVVAETISLRSRKAGRKVMLSQCLRWKKV
jgi:predicted MFS family arabinose efflux permease